MKKRRGVTHKIRDGWISKWKLENLHSDNYLSFLKTQDFVSMGAKSRVPDYEIEGQDRNLFSINELCFFLHLLRDQRITGIKEQYPLLPIERAMAIAGEMDIRYPTYPYSSQVEVVMTTDFLCKTIYGTEVAYSIKDSEVFHEKTIWSQKKKDNFNNKILLEKAFWETQNVKFYLISSEYLKSQYSRNLHLLAQYIEVDIRLKIFILCWIRLFGNTFVLWKDKRLSCYLKFLSNELGLSYFDSVKILFHCIWHRMIRADLNKNIVMERLVSSFRFNLPHER